MALVYPDETPPARKRKMTEELFSWDRHGEQDRL
jgi:hypothetical protein